MQLITSQSDSNQEAWDSTMIELAGKSSGETSMHSKVADIFPSIYKSHHSPEQALEDLYLLDQLQQSRAFLDHQVLKHSDSAKDGASNPIATCLIPKSVESVESTSKWEFRLMHADSAIPLSDILPLLEYFGFRVIGEQAFVLKSANQPEQSSNVWLHVFDLEIKDLSSEAVNSEDLSSLFDVAFQQVWQDKVDRDIFNKLVMKVSLNYKHVNMMRAYANYMKQMGLPFTRPTIAETLAKHPNLTRMLVDVFEIRFNPDIQDGCDYRREKLDALKLELLNELDNVESLTEDSIIRQYLTLIMATLRTSFYRDVDLSIGRHCLAFKLDARSIADLPKPRPMFEIFVFDRNIQGVHLRGGKVARGGLRWSDRQEDFRTEVLGLVKAQQVKNSVIVPMGAKGGFICKSEPVDDSRSSFIDNGIACYRLFINSLLSITDNLQNGQTIKPPQVFCWDGDDPYLVVAADKGTATFSDIANEISQTREFWLGDAFASGGSVGYDHKAMGITAKGAWVSVQRHFREMGVDVQKEDFSAVAVGDMAGDVFGNGMLCSEHICLKAAFNHLHIFIDPNPDSAKSFTERQRLFESCLGWGEYNQSLISQGGGIFSRSAKSIPLSPEIKSWLQTDANELTPNQLIHAILKADIDLFWNGGIGTYIKSKEEAHSDVGDRANNDVRVNGAEVGAKVIGEGGNLGATQLGRVEYSLKGGRCNTDFIDNAGGVDCSDHEVNIKILLDGLVASGALAKDQRNELLYSMTEEVSELVLHNNYRQTQAISLAESEAAIRAIEYQRWISELEHRGILDRAIEFIPTDEELQERKVKGQTLTRPEFSVLVSYAKLNIKSELLESTFEEDELISMTAKSAFPKRLRETYSDQITQHRLNREIIATQIAGDIVNRMGVTFVRRMQEATGESVANITKAYTVAINLFDVEKYWQVVEKLDGSVSVEVQNKMFSQIARLVRRSTRWLVRNCRSNINTLDCVARYKLSAEFLHESAGHLLRGAQKEEFTNTLEKYISGGVPKDLAKYISSTRYLYTTFALQRTVESTEKLIEQVSAAYFELGDSLSLNWFADQIRSMPVDNYWQALARESFRDELESQQAALTSNWLQSKEPEAVSNIVGDNNSDCKSNDFDAWAELHRSYIDRWNSMMNELLATNDMDIAMFPVALRELLDLVQVSEKTAA